MLWLRSLILRAVNWSSDSIWVRSDSAAPAWATPALKNKTGKHGHAVKRQHGFFAGNLRGIID
jgi:hypothetical protein